jgi:peptidoglycan-associated lipoprotein
MVCRARVYYLAFIALACMFVLCRKQKSTLDQQLPKKKADTAFVEPKPLGDVDTSDDVLFREADLEAEMERLVRENLKPVYFEFNSYTLSKEGTENLGIAANFLMEHSDMRVLIEGHCDERGSSEYNMGLGENRARAVKNFLKNYGVPSLQMEITSWGKERPAEAGCTDDECHGQNRRAEFKVLAK